jgi:hypothetical protein
VKFLYKFLLIFLITTSVKAGGFDDLGNSARVVSMGGAFVGAADAPYTIFYNPAGIYSIKNFLSQPLILIFTRELAMTN